MKRTCILGLSLIISAGVAYSQKSTFTGTVMVYGSGFNTRTTTRLFTLNINNLTTDSDAAHLLGILQDSGQDALLNAIKNKNMGNFSIGGQVARQINVVRVDDVGGKKRIRIVFERWKGFGEVRGGYRSLDYPFTYLELMVDPRTGKGEGTYIGAAKIRFRPAKNGDDQVEIEDFATYPGKLMGVTLHGGRLP